MKKLLLCVAMLCICLLIISQAHAQTVEYYGGIDPLNQGYQRFMAEHPDVTMKRWETYYNTTGEFIGALLTASFDSDVFSLNSAMHDYHQMMKKGYLLDLSGSEALRETIGRMHPSIAAQAMADGKIYGLPHSIGFDYTRVNEEGWSRAGLNDEDVPDSFPALLDFLERWCERAEATGEQNIRVRLFWDFGLYQQNSYAAWLVNYLIDSYILQKQYAGEALTFDEPELAELLERCKTIGRRIYDVEPRLSDGDMDGSIYGLFENGLQWLWPQSMSRVVNFRLNDTQPKLMQAWVDLYAVNARTVSPELCAMLLEEIAAGPHSPASNAPAFLYQDAEPILNPYYEKEVAHLTERVNTLRLRLADPDLAPDERFEAQEQLERTEYNLRLSLKDENKYYMSPAQLAEYKQYAQGLYFPPPSVFNNSQDSFKLMDNLQRQFASDVLSTEQFLGELARVARLIELENQ